MPDGILHTAIRDLILTLLHSERPKLYTILAFLSAMGLMKSHLTSKVVIYGNYKNLNKSQKSSICP